MKRVRINIPFTDKVTGRDYVTNDEINMTEERIAEVRSVGVNLISVLGEVDEPEKEPEAPEIPEEPKKEPEAPEIPEVPEKPENSEEKLEEEPKKPITRKKKEE